MVVYGYDALERLFREAKQHKRHPLEELPELESNIFTRFSLSRLSQHPFYFTFDKIVFNSSTVGICPDTTICPSTSTAGVTLTPRFRKAFTSNS